MRQRDEQRAQDETPHTNPMGHFRSLLVHLFCLRRFCCRHPTGLDYTIIERSGNDDNHVSCDMLRVRDLSGFVARNLSGRHSHRKEVTGETDETATGDPEDEIRGSE
jgi:hypothetical protein